MVTGPDTTIVLNVTPAEPTTEGAARCPACGGAFGKNSHRNPQFIKMVEKEFPNERYDPDILETCLKCVMVLNFECLGRMSIKTLGIVEAVKE